MDSKLKRYIANKEEEHVISVIRENPHMLDDVDESGVSVYFLLAYAGLNTAFAAAVELKKQLSFHEAVVAGKAGIVKEHLQRDSSLVDSYSTDGFTPLSLAAFFNQTETALLLLAAGADPGRKAINKSEVNALHSAVARENITLCEAFLKRGVDVNVPQMKGVTALHSAVHRGNLEMVKLLIQYGADLEVKMENGETALDIAEREGHKGIAAVLKSVEGKIGGHR